MAETRVVCPWCTEERGYEGKRNLAINYGRGLYTCFRCNRGGFVDDLPEHLQDGDADDADDIEETELTESVESSPLRLPGDLEYLNGREKKDIPVAVWAYLTERRGVERKTIKRATLGWAPSLGYTIVFPMCGTRGYLTRSILPDRNGYKNPKGFERKTALYDPWWRLGTNRSIYVVEGPLDALRVEGGVATLGKNVTTQQLDRLAEHTGELTVAMDGDAWRTSRSVAMRLRIRRRGPVYWKKLPPKEDPGSLGPLLQKITARKV